MAIIKSVNVGNIMNIQSGGRPMIGGRNYTTNFNEPVGYTTLFNYGMDTTPTSGAVLFTDETSIESPPTVTRVTLPVGYVAGFSPWSREVNIQSSNTTEIYMRIAMKHSSNWEGQ